MDLESRKTGTEPAKPWDSSFPASLSVPAALSVTLDRTPSQGASFAAGRYDDGRLSLDILVDRRRQCIHSDPSGNDPMEGRFPFTMAAVTEPA